MKTALQSATADEEIDETTEPELEEGLDDEEIEEEAEGPDESDDEGGAEEDAPPEDDDESPAEAEADDDLEEQAEEGSPEEGSRDKAPTPSNDTRPFKFRVDGAEVDVPGAVETDELVAMPREAWNRYVQPRLADREAWRRREADYKRQLETKSAKEIRAEKTIEKFDALLKLASEDEDKALEFLQDIGRQLPVLEREARIAELEAQVNRRQTVEQEAEDEERAAELRTQLEQDLRGRITEFSKDPRFAGVDVDRAHRRLWRIADKVYFQPDQDLTDPESGQVLVKKGEIGINFDLIREELAELAELSRGVATTTKKVEAAAETNRRALARPKAPPPGVSAKGSPAAGGEVKTFATKAEWEEHIDSLAHGR